jgi:hypothetical protein
MKWSASRRSRCSRRFIVTVGMTRTEHAVVVVAVVVRVVRPARQLSPKKLPWPELRDDGVSSGVRSYCQDHAAGPKVHHAFTRVALREDCGRTPILDQGAISARRCQQRLHVARRFPRHRSSHRVNAVQRHDVPSRPRSRWNLANAAVTRRRNRCRSLKSSYDTSTPRPGGPTLPLGSEQQASSVPSGAGALWTHVSDWSSGPGGPSWIRVIHSFASSRRARSRAFERL